jgi:hypothetical protein
VKKIYSSAHYCLFAFKISRRCPHVFILSYFNIFVIGASQLPVACILYSVSSFFVFFFARSVVKFHTYVVDVASCFYLSWSYRRFPSSSIVSVHFVAFPGSIHALFMAPCPVRTFLHFVPIGRLHLLRLFALDCEILVSGLLVTPSVLLTLFAYSSSPWLSHWPSR